jgi:hypothetical protein
MELRLPAGAAVRRAHGGSLRGERCPLSRVSGRRLVRGRTARVVFNKRLRFRLLVDDYVPFRPPKHGFEFFRLVARMKREAVILLSNHLVLGHGHLDLLLAAGGASFTRSAFAEKFKDEVLPLESGFGRPVESFDSLVHFPYERFVPRLPLKA